MTLVQLLLSFRSVVLLLLMVTPAQNQTPAQDAQQPTQQTDETQSTTGTNAVPAKLNIGLLLPKEGKYSGSIYMTVCKKAIKDMQAKSYLNDSEITYVLRLSAIFSFIY